MLDFNRWVLNLSVVFGSPAGNNISHRVFVSGSKMALTVTMLSIFPCSYKFFRRENHYSSPAKDVLHCTLIFFVQWRGFAVREKRLCNKQIFADLVAVSCEHYKSHI